MFKNNITSQRCGEMFLYAEKFCITGKFRIAA